MRGGCLLLKWLIKVEFKKFAFSTLSVAVELSVANVGNEELGFKTLNHFPEVLAFGAWDLFLIGIFVCCLSAWLQPCYGVV